MNNIIVIDFKNIISELENKNLKICFLKDRDIFIEDKQKKLYMKNYRSHSYLDKLIEDGDIVTFNLIDDKISKNIGNWEKEIWGVFEVKDFIKRQKLTIE
ncbi:hypothetical protein K144316041_p21620 (plasmid) [Clostridium tetani]|uniref:hypothetical protein n=1 Tax=Clostridium tetani TaxID=1513 RepID=UPI0029538A5C|nr:hypothetical protein [Clostridium tetani]BDR74323.1 hypothetical protein K144316041_p21620 [Clostridium tetani]